MRAGRVEWNSASRSVEPNSRASRSVELNSRASRSVEPNSRTEANTVPSGAEWTSDKTAIGQRRLEQKDERRINDPN